MTPRSSPLLPAVLFLASMGIALGSAMSLQRPPFLVVTGVCGMGVLGLLLFRRISLAVREAERARDQSEDYIEALAGLSLETHALLDARTRRYLYVSPALEGMLGYAPEDLKSGGLPFLLERIHPDDRPRVEAALDLMLESGSEAVQEEVYRIRNQGGEYRRVRSRRRVLARDGDGRPLEILTVTRDISDERAPEAAPALAAPGVAP
jgi:PAS domain S-box-containing protein